MGASAADRAGRGRAGRAWNEAISVSAAYNSTPWRRAEHPRKRRRRKTVAVRTLAAIPGAGGRRSAPPGAPRRLARGGPARYGGGPRPGHPPARRLMTPTIDAMNLPDVTITLPDWIAGAVD